jgi:dihydroorotate dehydrogenase electron transfer subunit
MNRRVAHRLPAALTLSDVSEAGGLTRIFAFESALPAAPGQFVMLWLPGLDEKPFSLLSDDPLAVAVAAVGPFSRALHLLLPGDKVWVRGPFGHGFEPGNEVGHLHLLVGGGYGAAPLLFLANRLVGSGGAADNVMAVIGARTADDVLLADEMRALGVAVDVTTEDGTAGRQGVVTDVVAPVLDGSEVGMLYACGPHGMLEALSILCEKAGVPAQLSWEAYMRCGLGLCGSCEHEGRLVCADGPVFHQRP